jgi:predicted metal-dependent peptidase
MAKTIELTVVTQQNIEEAMRLVIRARIQMLIYQPFFGSLAMGLDPVHDLSVETMATDGRRLFFAAPFVLQLKGPELVAVLVHEVMHVANLHMTRRGLRDPQAFNIACDYAINGTLAQACASSQGSMIMPKCGLLDAKYIDKSAEWIYDQLEKQGKGRGRGRGGQNEGQGEGQGKDPGGMGGVIDARDAKGNPLSEADRNILENDVKVAVFQAAMAAKSRGNFPACLERMIEEMRAPQIDWKDKLRRFWSAQFPSDYSFSRPNRRFVHAGTYLPGVIKDGVGVIAVAIDTSGSVGAEELRQFLGEINSIADENSPEELHVVSCDAAVATHQVFLPGDTVDHTTVKTGGGGGTSFVPPFAHLAKKDIRPQCLIYLTDGYGDFPQEPDYPTLWVMTTDVVSPVGDTVQIKVGR